MAGRGTATGEFDEILKRRERDDLLEWLKSQKWYGITGDNEHLRRFWQQNFNTHPDFRPNYIVPNIHSIIRSLCVAPGLGVLPDFLCLREIERGSALPLDLGDQWDFWPYMELPIDVARERLGVPPRQPVAAA